MKTIRTTLGRLCVGIALLGLTFGCASLEERADDAPAASEEDSGDEERAADEATGASAAHGATPPSETASEKDSLTLGEDDDVNSPEPVPMDPNPGR